MTELADADRAFIDGYNDGAQIGEYDIISAAEDEWDWWTWGFTPEELERERGGRSIGRAVLDLPALSIDKICSHYEWLEYTVGEKRAAEILAELEAEEAEVAEEVEGSTHT
ncbi:hypothetical protein ETAA8_45640 [Anatilimnocola aggregata]|uniref:Uncharacterized protein n=1 Tax=Anatilimnocola aggregata TaxID=2528021 RepID=A0A517YGU2_9BACT|nr:hypothetical protein [Anatilimnocola aggregata]QDU29454.1 hypothetical protein ETAA8_45640 [Anatilimnocola aggregata]